MPRWEVKVFQRARRHEIAKHKMNTRNFSNSFLAVFPFRSLVGAMALLASVWLVSAQPDPLSVWTNRPYTRLPGDYFGLENYGFSRVIYAQGIFAAVGSSYDNGTIITSPDGLQWASQSVSVPGAPSFPGAVYDICYGGGRFVAVGWCGTTVTGNGTNWTEAVITYPDRCGPTMEGVTYGSGYFVAVGYGGTTNCMVSTNGSNWVMRKSVVGFSSLKHVAYGNGEFIATSDDGIARAPAAYLAYPTSFQLFLRLSSLPSWDVAFGAGVFVITSPTGIYLRANGDFSYTLVNTSSVRRVSYTTGGFVGLTTDAAHAGEVGRRLR